jgi:hypothetical protein
MDTHSELEPDWSSIRASSFGERLRHLRRNRPGFLTHEDCGRFPTIRSRRLTVSALCGCLEVHGYHIGRRTYRDIEADRYLPDDLVLFLDVISQCLRLSDREVEDLLRQVSYDILRDALGDVLAWEILTRGETEQRGGSTEL